MYKRNKLRGGGQDTLLKEYSHNSSKEVRQPLSKIMLAASEFALNNSSIIQAQLDSNAKTHSLKSQIVTANKIDQNLQEIDGSVLVVSGKTLSNTNITNTENLSKIFPGFVLKPSSGPGAIYGGIRGISSTDPWFPSIRLYVDGIPQDVEFLTQELINVERIELLRGPQGTIWGENAQAGVLNIVSRPINQPSISANTTASSLQKRMILSAFAPLVHNALFIGGNFSYNQFSGMIKSKNQNQNTDTSDSLNGSIRLEFAPKNSNFSALFKTSFSNLTDHRGGFYLTSEEIDKLEVDDKKFIPTIKRDAQTYALKLAYNFDKTQLTNALSYQKLFYHQALSNIARGDTRKSLTDELRLITAYDNGAYSIFGLYYQNLYSNNEIPGTRNASVLGEDATNTIDRNNLGVFGEGKIILPKDLSLTLGARYSFDYSKVDFSGRNIGTCTASCLPVTPAYNKTFSSHTFTPKISLGYDINQENRAYLLYQTSYKPGGFAVFPSAITDQNPVKPETSHNVELGLHSNLDEDTIALNATFYYIYTANKQVYVGEVGGRSLRNIGTTNSLGIELSLETTIVEKLRLSFGGAFGRSYYIEGFEQNIHGIKTKSLKNNILSYAPDISFNLNADWNFWDFSYGKLYANVNQNFYSTLYFQEDNHIYQKPYALTDISLRLELKNHLSFNLFASNIWNQKYINYSYNSKTGNILGDIKDIGLNLTYDY